MKVPKPLAASLGVVATLGLLTGCASASTPAASDAAGDVSLTFWARGGSLPDDVQAILDKQFPDYEIKFQNIPDIEDKLRTAIRAKSGLPDVVIMGGALPSFFEVSNQFIDLKEQAADSDAVEWGLELGQNAEGQQIGLPTDIGPWGFFYRADVLEKLGYPSEPDEVSATFRTWDEYRALAEAASASGQFACDHAGQVYQSRLAQDGYAYFLREDGKDVNAVDSPISHDAFVESADLAQAGLCANAEPYTPEWNAALTQEKIVAFVGPAWEDGLLKSAGEKQAGQWRIATVPAGPAATGGSFVTAMSASKHPDAAAEVAGFIASAAFQKPGYQQKGLFPASTGVFDDPEVATPQEFYAGQDTLGQLASTAKEAPLVYQSPNANVVSSQFFVALNDLAFNGKDPESVYNDLVKANKAN